MKRILIACISLLGLTACTDDYEAINTNPNSPVTVPTSFLIANAERGLADLIVGEGFSGPGTFGSHYIQHLSQTQYTDVTNYDDIRTSFYPFYAGSTPEEGPGLGSLQDLQTVIDLNTADETSGAASASGPNENQIALSRIVQSWVYLSMTDFWGDIPYSEALQGLGNLTPKYDTQEDIYRGVVNTLVEAGDQISDAGGIDGDLLFGGDMEKVRRFANSLILRAGIRVSDVAPELGNEWANLAVSRGVLTSNEDNVQFEYDANGGEAANNTFFTDFLTRTDYAISSVLTDYLNERNDPRIVAYAQPTANSATANDFRYIGMPYGLTQGEAGAIDIADVSYPGLSYIGVDAPAILLTYSEVLFNQAEAAARGWITGDAESFYNDAIRASMSQNGIDDLDIEDYLEQDIVSYDGDNFEKSIGEQKWVALYFQGAEAWSEWRRLGFPELSPSANGIQINTIPTRRGYPDNEFTLNRENYLEALMRQFGTSEDPLDGRVWWDVD